MDTTCPAEGTQIFKNGVIFFFKSLNWFFFFTVVLFTGVVKLVFSHVAKVQACWDCVRTWFCVDARGVAESLERSSLFLFFAT